jgi:hypothetical protein
MLLAPAVATQAHPVYMDHIEHRVELTVGSTNIDISIELRFNEVQSLAERRRMDIDRDNAISQAECEGYLRRITGPSRTDFQLSCDGRALELIQLYDPQIDFLGVNGVSPNHHVLKLSYFARTPATVVKSTKKAVELAFEDRSWRGVPALWLFAANARDGLDATTLPTTEADSQPAGRDAPAPALVGRCRIKQVRAETASPHTNDIRSSGPTPAVSAHANTSKPPGGPPGGRSFRRLALLGAAAGMFLAGVLFARYRTTHPNLKGDPSCIDHRPSSS